MKRPAALVALLARRRRRSDLERKAYYAFPPRRHGSLVVAARVARLVLLGAGVVLVLVATGTIR